MIAELLRDVLEHPDDNGPRLVYADALLQAGDPRGELITLQCCDGPKPTVDALIERLKPRWLEILGKRVTAIRFERGFPFAVDLWIGGLEDDVLDILDRAPIHHLRLHFDEEQTQAQPAALAFRRDLRTRHVRSLDLTGDNWGEEALPSILGANLPALRTLYIGDYDSQTHVAQTIVANESLALETLSLFGDSYGDFSDGLAMLSVSPRAESLQELLLDNTGLGPGDAQAIASSPWFASLCSLSLTGGSNTTNRILDTGMIALTGSPHLGRLTTLQLGSNHLTDASVSELADPSRLPALHSLAINHSEITDEVLSQIVQARPFEGLYLGGCRRVGDAGVIALARSPHVHQLRSLNVHGTSVGAAGVQALIASKIEKLDYLGVSVDDELRELLIQRFGDAAKLFKSE